MGQSHKIKQDVQMKRTTRGEISSRDDRFSTRFQICWRCLTKPLLTLKNRCILKNVKMNIYRKLEERILEDIKTAPHGSDKTRLVMVSRKIFSSQLNLEKRKLKRSSNKKIFACRFFQARSCRGRRNRPGKTLDRCTT